MEGNTNANASCAVTDLFLLEKSATPPRTDVEDKQVLSIESQLAELRTLAKQERLNVVEVFVEKRSAKMPGRTESGRSFVL